MAKAKRVTPKKPKDTIVLELTEDEALFLSAVLNGVGGCPKESLRRHQAPISIALEGVRILADSDFDEEIFSGSLFFKQGKTLANSFQP